MDISCLKPSSNNDNVYTGIRITPSTKIYFIIRIFTFTVHEKPIIEVQDFRSVVCVYISTQVTKYIRGTPSSVYYFVVFSPVEVRMVSCMVFIQIK